MGKLSVRKRLIAGLAQVNAHVANGNQCAAQAVITELRHFINENNPNAAARKRTVLDAREQRVADMRGDTSTACAIPGRTPRAERFAG